MHPIRGKAPLASTLAASLFLCEWLVAPAGATNFRLRFLRCPVCGKEHRTVYTASYTVMFLPRYTRDRQRLGTGPSLSERYFTCRRCLFSGTAKDFEADLGREARRELRVRLRARPSPFRGRYVDESLECENVAAIYRWQKRRFWEIAEAYRVGSYFLRSAGGRKARRRKELQRLAARFYIEAVRADEFVPPKRAEIKYLVGEFFRRTGSFGYALLWYAAAHMEARKPYWLDRYIAGQVLMALDRNADNNL